MFFCCFEAFLGKLTEKLSEKLSFYSKNNYLRKKLRNTQKDYFSQEVWKKRKAIEKFGFGVTNVFVQSSKMGQLLTKTVNIHKMSHIQLNCAFLLFRSVIGLIHSKHLFLVQKVSISERSTKTLRKFVFLNKFEKRQILSKI